MDGILGFGLPPTQPSVWARAFEGLVTCCRSFGHEVDGSNLVGGSPDFNDAKAIPSPLFLGW